MECLGRRALSSAMSCSSSATRVDLFSMFVVKTHWRAIGSSVFLMGDDADETEGVLAQVAVSVGLIRRDVKSHSGAHGHSPLGPLGNSFACEDKDLVLKGMLVLFKDGAWGELDHAHGEIRSPFWLADDPANGDSLAYLFLWY